MKNVTRPSYWTSLYNDYHDSRLRDLADCAPVLKRVRKLDPGFIDTRELFSDDGSCLDAICEHHDIALVMKHRGEYRRLFEKSAHIRRRLVDLDIPSSPEEGDFIMPCTTLQKHHFQVVLTGVNNVQELSNCIHANNWSFRCLTIWRPLKSEEDVVLFKQILRTHPNTHYEVRASDTGILRLLLDHDDDHLLSGVTVHFLDYKMLVCERNNRTRGLSVACEPRYLHHMSALDLSSLNRLVLSLGYDEK